MGEKVSVTKKGHKTGTEQAATKINPLTVSASRYKSHHTTAKTPKNKKPVTKTGFFERLSVSLHQRHPAQILEL